MVETHKIPFRQKMIIPDGAPGLQEKLGLVITQMPYLIKNPTGGDELELGELQHEWPTEDGPAYVGSIPVYLDRRDKLVYIPRGVLNEITGCLSTVEEDLQLPPYMRILS